jgi:hypothetical protein
MACLLSDPDLGIITENDHKVGKCLCALCTCGKHRCPGKRLVRYNSLESSYQADYKSHKPVAVPRAGPFLPYIQASGVMDLRSTMQTDYQPPASPVKSEMLRVEAVSPQLAFVGSSSYAANYPDWGPSQPQIEHRPYYQSHTEDLQFQGQSSYRRAYKQLETRSFDRLSPPPRSRSILGLAGEGMARDTTARRSFQLRPGYGDYTFTRPKEKSDYTPLRSPPCHHVTTSLVSFSGAQPGSKDPQLLRRRKLPLL